MVVADFLDKIGVVVLFARSLCGRILAHPPQWSLGFPVISSSAAGPVGAPRLYWIDPFGPGPCYASN